MNNTQEHITENHLTIGQQVASLAIVVIMSGVAGSCVGLLGGYHFPKILCFKGYELKPILKAIVIPPLIAMIIMSIITRNYFGPVTKNFPDKWASFIKSICLGILLIRGGLQVTFKGKGLLLLVMTALPQSVEASIGAWICKGLTDYPIFICYALAYSLACISPSIIVPGCIGLDSRGFGRKKGIASSMIAAGTFDDILCIIMFGIFSALAFFQAGDSKTESKGPGHEIGMIILEIVTGLGFGIVFGLAAWLFKFIHHWKWQLWFKALWCISVAIGFVLAAELTGFKEAKYIGTLFFGYTSFQFWGMNKPTKELAQIWFFLQPILFACVGGGLSVSTINPDLIGYSILIIMVGLIMRFLTTFFVTYSKSYNVKERIFMAICWLPKATVQAVLSGMFLKEAKNRDLPEFITYGEFIQSTCVISIIICAPLGAILINSLGPKLLTNDVEVELREIEKRRKEGLEDPKKQMTKTEEQKTEEDPEEGVHESEVNIAVPEEGPKQRVFGLDPQQFSTSTDMVKFIAL